MKTIYSLLLPVIALGFSCTDKYTEELTVNAPVMMSYADLRSAVAYESARALVHPGKIYFKGDYLLIVEYLEGIHVVDVSRPSQPQNAGFIVMPGCVDIAVKEQSLYADSYVDLVTVDISDVAHPKETGRITDMFPYTVPTPDNPDYPCTEVNQQWGVVVDWEVRHEKHELKTATYSLPMYGQAPYNRGGQYAISADAGGMADSGGLGVTVFGKSGSMARFGLYGNYLYIVSEWRLYMFDTGTSATPVSAGFQGVSSGIETMFVYDGHLFFGTPGGMLVYSLRMPSAPEYVGQFWHVTSCDPVVVQDGYAYITLRTGTNCGGGVNRLDVVRISDDYREYDLVNSYNMVNPHGLGIDGDRLFICDGSDGLKIYDAADKENVTGHLLAAFPGIRAYDVIPTGAFLFMIGDDGFYLYDYSDLTDIRQIGYIAVEKTE
jgi:hypothetical protein